MNKIDQFEIISKIGEGGMAQVYLVRDERSGSFYALKQLIIKADNKSPQLRHRFEQEMKIYSRVKSPYVAQFHAGKLKNTETPYMIMEYVNGVMLKDFIKRQGGFLQHDIAARLTSELAAGFAEIHANGVIHRDIKTSNVMIENGTNSAKIIDFGIALSHDAERFTMTGKIIGSVHYLAPEITRQEEPSIQSDIYALGILLYEMLTGQTPFHGADAINILSQHRNSKLPDIRKFNPETPNSLINIVIRATAKDRNNRYPSMLKFKEDIDRYLTPRKSFSGTNKSEDDEKKGFFGRFFKK